MKSTLILGPPGTGKTTYLIDRVKEYLAQGKSVVYVAFTKKAATEAQNRGLSGDFRTIHSLVYRGLGLGEGALLQWSDYRMIGNALNMKFSRSITSEEAVSGGGTEGDRIRSMVDYASATMQDPEDLPTEDIDIWRLRRYVQTLSQYKLDTGRMDFNDILIRGYETLDPLDVDVAIIDEAQDLSPIQWRVVNKLFSNVNSLLIAGDDDQAIFRWAGADVQGFIDLKTDETIVLEQSYRVPSKIWHQAVVISSRISQRHLKYWSPTGADSTLDRIGRPEDVDLGREGTYFLLARNRYLLMSWIVACRNYGVTYNIYGKSSVKKQHLRAIRAWGALSRGSTVLDKDRRLVGEYLKEGLSIDNPSSTYWYDALVGIPVEDAQYYRAILRRGGDLDAEPRYTISTIHGVKGGEADHVAVMSDWSTLTDQGAEVSPDDEHRVFYVAVTRAKKTLTLVEPQGIQGYNFF